MRIRKVNSVDVKLYDLTKVKLKTAGSTSVVQFTAGNNICNGLSKGYAE